MKELKLVSSNAIIAELYQDFNLAGSEWVHKAKRWVARGIEIMELSGYFERATLWDNVAEYSVILPCDLRVLGVVLVEGVTDYAFNSFSAPIATTPAANSTDANGNRIELDFTSNTGLFRLPLSNSLSIGQTVWYEYDVTNCDKMYDGIYWVNLSLSKFPDIIEVHNLSSIYIVTISGGEGVISAISELCEVV